MEPQGKMTMSSEKLLVLHDVIKSVTGPELRAPWVDERLKLEIAGFDDWKRASGL